MKSSPSDGSPFRRTADGVRVEVKVTPRAGRAGIDGLIAESAGNAVLKVAVTAPPEDGKANRAVVELLAKEWKIPKTAFAVAVGATGRRKSIAIAGDPTAIGDRLDAWLKERHG